MKSKTLYLILASVSFIVLLWLSYYQSYIEKPLAGSIVLVLFAVVTYFINRLKHD